MGFGLTFIAMHNGEKADGDRAGLLQFLADRQLVVAPSAGGYEFCDLFHADGRRLTFDDGYLTDLRIRPPDAQDHVEGSISHAQLGPLEMEFVFALCEAAGWFVINQQGGGDKPLVLLLCSGELGVEDLWDPEVAHTTVANAEELQAALTGSYESFLEFRDRALQPRTQD